MLRQHNYCTDSFEEYEVHIPEFSSSQKDSLAEMLTAQGDAAKRLGKNIITNDPMDYIGEQERKGQQIVRVMGGAGLILSNPDLILTISEKDWSIQDRIAYMSDKELLYNNKYVDGYTNWINRFKKRQKLSTGVVPMLSKELQMLGYGYSDMIQSNKLTSADISRATADKYGSAILGVIPNLDYYAQSKEKCDEMMGKGEYTSDINFSGDVVAIRDFGHYGQVHLDVNLGGHRWLDIGSRRGVIKSESLEV